jgi:hypothetical protein
MDCSGSAALTRSPTVGVFVVKALGCVVKADATAKSEAIKKNLIVIVVVVSGPINACDRIALQVEVVDLVVGSAERGTPPFCVLLRVGSVTYVRASPGQPDNTQLGTTRHLFVYVAISTGMQKPSLRLFYNRKYSFA